ncbi:Dipeptidase PepE [Balamuthia mandrillaris]
MHARRRLLLISNSTLHGSGYLEHCSDTIKGFLLRESPQRMNVLFVPWALRDWDNYENTAKKAFEANGFSLRSIHQHADPVQAVEEADAIFIGGGNSFRLLKALYDNNVIEPIRQRVAQGMPYIGTSAGSNVACCSIRTTNDMPIVYPPSFDALNLVPFNINPHYLDPDPSSKHMGETREKRLQEFHEVEENQGRMVVGLREGAMLHVEDDSVQLEGINGARVFVHGQQPKEHTSGSDLSFLLQSHQ